MSKHNHKGHRDRVKRKFNETGLLTFNPHEVIELLLFYGKPQGDTNEIAHKLIGHYGNISSIFDAPFQDLVERDGIGEHSATLLKLIPELSRVYLESPEKKVKLNNIKECANYFLPKFVGRTSETLMIAFLDNNSNVIKCEIISEGSANTTKLESRKILKSAFLHNASGAILAHNHPDGDSTPSEQDKYTTLLIREYLRIIQVDLVDHIVVAGQNYTSMRQKDLF